MMLLSLENKLHTPVLGGCCMGMVTATVLLYAGGILGVSGLIKGATSQERKPEQVAFVTAFLAGSWTAKQLRPSAFAPLPEGFSLVRSILGGLCTGAGATVGGGCTSGHGICGISRLAFRSLTFIAVAMSCGAIVASTSCTAKAVFDPTAPAAEPVSYQLDNLILASSVMLLIAPPIYSASSLRPDHVKIKTLVYSGAGFLFALGLASSCMTLTAKVVAFLTPRSADFDISLAFVMASAVGVAIIPFQMVFHWKLLKSPMLVDSSFVVPPTSVDRKLLTGAVLFGAGWGATGLCPGPAIANLVVPSIPSWGVVVAMLLGMQLPPWLSAISKTKVLQHVTFQDGMTQ